MSFHNLCHSQAEDAHRMVDHAAVATRIGAVKERLEFLQDSGPFALRVSCTSLLFQYSFSVSATAYSRSSSYAGWFEGASMSHFERVEVCTLQAASDFDSACFCALQLQRDVRRLMRLLPREDCVDIIVMASRLVSTEKY